MTYWKDALRAFPPDQDWTHYTRAMAATLERAQARYDLAVLAACELLRTQLVQSDGGGPKTRTMAGVPSAVRTVDAFVGELTGGDPGGIKPTQEARRSAIASALPGEIALAADFIDLALTAAELPVDCEERRDARAWLQDHSRIYSARLCFEALGLDFDLVRKLLLKKWLKKETT